jgi:hypothetical protein
MRTLLRKHKRNVPSIAFLTLRDGDGVLALATPSLRVALGHS